MHDQSPAKPPNAITQVNDDDMAIFVGKDWAKYQPMWNSIKYKKDTKEAFAFKNLNWLAFFFGPVWFAYRKMYLSMIGYLAICFGLETMLDFFFQRGAPGITYGIAAMLSSRLIYFYVNAPRILAIRNAGGSEEEIKEKLAKAGGVSNVSLWIGLIICALLTALVIWSAEVTHGNDVGFDESDLPSDGSISTDTPHVEQK